MKSTTTKNPEQLWQNFLSMKRDEAWWKTLQRFVSIDKLPADLRCKIGSVAMQEAEMMSSDMRRDTYCLITMHIPEFSAKAWEMAQEMGVTSADYATFTIMHKMTSGINVDEAKKFANKVSTALSNLGAKVGQKFKDALEVSPAGQTFEKFKKSL